MEETTIMNVFTENVSTYFLQQSSDNYYNSSLSTYANVSLNFNPNECNFAKDVWKNDVYKITFLSIIIICIALATTGGNLLVMVSFKIEPQLRTISNCFLLSLAVADITIGIFSIPLYSMYLLLEYHWPLGLFVCDVWLSLDYTMSNASVANLLLISFDRYFSVTRPLTYRAHRTPVKAGIMIACAWIISILLWTPWIMIWPRVSGEKRSENDCYIAFLDNTSTGGIVLTFVTAFGAFFIPVFVMCILYFKIYRETEKRKKTFVRLRGADHGSKDKESHSYTKQPTRSAPASKKSNDSDNRNNQDNFNKENISKNTTKQINPTNKIDNNGHNRSLIRQQSNENETKSQKISTIPQHILTKMPNKIVAHDKNSTSKSGTIPSQTRKKRTGQDQKAAKTLSAILLAFIVTWTPYNIFVLVQTFFPCAIHPTLYAVGYWLCYLNSTINPVCYALCNELFRSSFLRILRCQWGRTRATYSHQNSNSVRI